MSKTVESSVRQQGVLLLRLQGPLQSWGERSRWDVRDTADIPTKSGVVGMIAAAFGWKRGDKRIVSIQDNLRFGVRVERSGIRLVDFQTVTGVLPSADGKHKGNENDPYTIISPRVYLQDACFLVGLEGSQDLLESCSQALQAPHWPYFLGRKSCPPGMPVIVGLQDNETLQQALTRAKPDQRLDDRPLEWPMSLFIETLDGEISVRDRNLARPAREYGLNRYHEAKPVQLADIPVV